ncbi:inner membrane protein YpjD [Limnohabitans sp. G3-2]|uniref:cytochrome C assembly family protein n=1 Tax=Limnohabitans sp. G3-2 TaxID=1100711 RepID=UPI000C1E0B77|nr:cytochrome c biogenesis protein CcsA [Limnohabitans sp. G3-2]PIT75759.1 cytochrome C assembly protein [Limnohabitans sp. G3-2]
MILASPPFWTLPATVLAALAYGLPALAGERLSHAHARRLLGIAWAAHAVALLSLWVGPAHFGFAPAISVTAWLVVSAYILESQFFPKFKARWTMGSLGALAVVLAWFFPGSPLSAQASAWLPLHWALGLSAYGMFGAAVVHGWMMTRAERDIRQAHDASSGVPLLTLERLTFRFVLAGFVLLTATLVAGVLFGDALYGQGQGHWRWDHKTIFALLSWLTFAVLLWGRSQWGWRGRRAVRVLYIGASLLLLSYAGSRFVMEILLGRMG